MKLHQAELVQLLLTEDEPADVGLVEAALAETKLAVNLSVAKDGVELLEHLRNPDKESAPRPDLILLDLNLPRKSGQEALAEIKADPELCEIPIVIMTSSDAETDIVMSYKLHANCYVRKPLDMVEFEKVVQSISNFWFTIVKLPNKR